MNSQKTGEFIKLLRKENNLTQLELSQKLNCTDKAISRWETGKGLPDADMLLSLSDFFGVSINEILLGEKFVLPQVGDKDIDVAEKTQTIEEIISSTDETIVDILKDKEKVIRRNRGDMLVVIACCLQAINLIVLPPVIVPLIKGADNLIIYGSIVSFVLVGLIRSKSKWVYPLVNVACILFWMLINGGDDADFYFDIAFYYGVLSVGAIGIIELMRYIIKKIKQ